MLCPRPAPGRIPLPAAAPAPAPAPAGGEPWGWGAAGGSSRSGEGLDGGRTTPGPAAVLLHAAMRAPGPGTGPLRTQHAQSPRPGLARDLAQTSQVSTHRHGSARRTLVPGCRYPHQQQNKRWARSLKQHQRPSPAPEERGMDAPSIRAAAPRGSLGTPHARRTQRPPKSKPEAAQVEPGAGAAAQHRLPPRCRGRDSAGAKARLSGPSARFGEEGDVAPRQSA